ncbi:MAG: hypothetical protein H6654_09285 [Ardenticatenaceae bacterium]|nr:hypothetical protein [Anaerolineales bacterium]MCB8938605.1 hypothetical protein [Ardenticatenaceae bacterium]MCB8973738.1 hypothetical protein [Ardenticatenaceae bacterium]
MRQAKRVAALLLALLMMCGLAGANWQTIQAGSDKFLYLPLVSVPSLGPNLLPNGSFEQGWYHIDNIPELQIPHGWQFTYADGANPLDPDPWNVWVRPETRVLPSAFLPPEEHELFIWDGDQTVKVFKGFGAIQFELTTNMWLQPGSYILVINVFPDLVVGYDNGQKIWAPDPLSGEVKLIAGNGTTGWLLPKFGQKNSFQARFTITTPQTVKIGAAMRGRWAIENNGWFLDDWGLYKP